MIEYLDKYVDKFYEAMTGHPKIGLLFIILCLAIWLVGIILNWKWTYEKGSTLMDYYLNGIVSDNQFRFIIGVIVFIALASAICLFLFY